MSEVSKLSYTVHIMQRATVQQPRVIRVGVPLERHCYCSHARFLAQLLCCCSSFFVLVRAARKSLPVGNNSRDNRRIACAGLSPQWMVSANRASGGRSHEAPRIFSPCAPCSAFVHRVQSSARARTHARSGVIFQFVLVGSEIQGGRWSRVF